jgi:hypothetical protein
MAIFCDPFPFNGIDRCGSVIEAQVIVNCAKIVDSEHPHNLWSYLSKLKFLDHNFKIKSGTKISNIRKHIAQLWELMSPVAKTAFVEWQTRSARDYLLKCEQMRKEV